MAFLPAGWEWFTWNPTTINIHGDDWMVNMALFYHVLPKKTVAR